MWNFGLFFFGLGIKMAGRLLCTPYLRAVSATSPPRPALFLDDAAVVAVVIRRRRVVPPPLPFQPAPVRVLGGVQQIDSRCGKRASVVAFFSAPAVVGGPVVAVAAPVLLGVAAVGAREAPTPAEVFCSRLCNLSGLQRMSSNSLKACWMLVF
jgi:hypothetical protein